MRTRRNIKNIKAKQNKPKINKSKKTLHKLNYYGGHIGDTAIFNNIKSIGFEIETTDLVKFTKQIHNDIEILTNSTLTNIDFEFGYDDPNEYTYIINEDAISFKITNDSAEDSEFNEMIKHTVLDINQDEDEQCDDIVFKMEIPNKTTYDIYFKEQTDEDLHNCMLFSDVEWIATYYKPTRTTNIILTYFYDCMNKLITHLSSLTTINNSKMLYLNENKEFTPILNTQTYELPTTSLIYCNTNNNLTNTYDINNDLKIVVQMTFSCDIEYVYRIMKQLLSLKITNKDIEILKKYTPNSAILAMNKMIDDTRTNNNVDEYAVDSSIEIIKELFKIYNEDAKNSQHPLLNDTKNVKKIKNYLFLIIYKLFIYINYYLERSETMFKKQLSFAVRHNNYSLYKEIRKLIKLIYPEANDIDIIDKLILPMDKNKTLIKKMFAFSYARNKKNEMLRKDINEFYGDPVASIANYFKHFTQPKDYDNDEGDREGDDNELSEGDNELAEGEGEEEEEEGMKQYVKEDWLVANNIDEKSTKFPLENNTIIIEFRDFPSYLFLYFFMNSNDSIREQMLKNNIGTLNIKTVKDIIGLHIPL